MVVPDCDDNFYTNAIRYYISRGVNYALAIDAANHLFDTWYCDERPYRYTSSLIH